jgi:hypothetical protein
MELMTMETQMIRPTLEYLQQTKRREFCLSLQVVYAVVLSLATSAFNEHCLGFEPIIAYPSEPVVLLLPFSSDMLDEAYQVTALVTDPGGGIRTNMVSRQNIIATVVQPNTATNALLIVFNTSDIRADILTAPGQYRVLINSTTNFISVPELSPAEAQIAPLFQSNGTLLRIALVAVPSDLDDEVKAKCQQVLQLVTSGRYADYARTYLAIDSLYQPSLNSEQYEGQPPPDFLAALTNFAAISVTNGLLRGTYLFHKGYAEALIGDRAAATNTLTTLLNEFPSSPWSGQAQRLLSSAPGEDTNPPIITILGANPATNECGSAYADAGATATDDVDGDVTSAIIVTDEVLTNIVGTYTVTYTVSDSSTNIATATRTVHVVDTTPPVLTLTGAATLTNECHAAFTDPGATASDTCDGDLTPVIQVSGTVNTNTVGTYTLTYIVRDSSSNEVSATRSVVVADRVTPALTLLGSNPLTLECHTAFSDPGATASDACAGDLTSVIQTTGTVNTNAVGSYTRTYTVSDPSGNTNAATRIVQVLDTTAPVIACPTNLVTTTDTGQCTRSNVTYSATATDACATPSVVCNPASGSTFSLGTNTVTCTATDPSSNSASCNFTVTVNDAQAPTITCPSNQTVVATNFCGNNVAFTQATATDNCSVASLLCSPSSGEALGPGVHPVTCTAVDASSNSNQCSFNVTVLDPLRVIFQGPAIQDDNVQDNIETDADVVNQFKAGSKILHKIELRDCAGSNVTVTVASSVTVRIDVTLRTYTNNTSTVVNDVPEEYSGSGSSGGVMVLSGNHFQYNLDTAGYPAGTLNNSQFFRSHITVEYNTNPGIVVGEEDALLESEP